MLKYRAVREPMALKWSIEIFDTEYLCSYPSCDAYGKKYYFLSKEEALTQINALIDKGEKTEWFDEGY